MYIESLQSSFSKDSLKRWLSDVVDRLIASVEDLSPKQQIGPYSPLLNPPLWEISHALWFIEQWTLRDLFSNEPYFEDVDSIYDSTVIPHEDRWSVDLIPLERISEYSQYLKSTVSKQIENSFNHDKFVYRLLYSIYHGDMHTEAITFQRQSRALPPPKWIDKPSTAPSSSSARSMISETIRIPGGVFPLGAFDDNTFVFDNEKWSHDVTVEPFEIDKTPITQSQFMEFVEANCYEESKYWSRDGWEWLKSRSLNSPLYWRKSDDQWYRRQFDKWVSVEPDKPMVHVNYYEAEAFCNWKNVRLPTEAEWALAAAGKPEDQESNYKNKLTYPWGNEQLESSPKNMDWNTLGPTSVNDCPELDSPWGCRQMLGNVWEWTQTNFEPFSGFEPDFYDQFSKPWFGVRKVLKGGSWSSRLRMIRNGYRNHYTPSRHDRYLGFRTCALND